MKQEEVEKRIAAPLRTGGICLNLDKLSQFLSDLTERIEKVYRIQNDEIYSASHFEEQTNDKISDLTERIEKLEGNKKQESVDFGEQEVNKEQKEEHTCKKEIDWDKIEEKFYKEFTVYSREAAVFDWFKSHIESK